MTDYPVAPPDLTSVVGTVDEPDLVNVLYSQVAATPPDLTSAVGSVLRHPYISSVNPDHRGVGQNITITGEWFGVSQGTSYATIGGVLVTNYISWSDTSIVCTVPAGAESGDLLVWVA